MSKALEFSDFNHMAFLVYGQYPTTTVDNLLKKPLEELTKYAKLCERESVPKYKQYVTQFNIALKEFYMNMQTWLAFTAIDNQADLHLVLKDIICLFTHYMQTLPYAINVKNIIAPSSYKNITQTPSKGADMYIQIVNTYQEQRNKIQTKYNNQSLEFYANWLSQAHQKFMMGQPLPEANKNVLIHLTDNPYQTYLRVAHISPILFKTATGLVCQHIYLTNGHTERDVRNLELIRLITGQIQQREKPTFKP